MNGNSKDLTVLIGMKYNKLTMFEEVEAKVLHCPSGKIALRRVRCVCECGNEVIVEFQKLKSGHTKSCGCILRNPLKWTSTIIDGKKVEGEHPLYSVWEGIKARCYNPNNDRYYRYGGRGIKVCGRWLNSFDNFYHDMIQSYEDHVAIHGKKNTTIDRYPDQNGNYEQGNCRWATYKQQNNNYSRNVIVEINGEKMTRTQACDKLSLSHRMINSRMNRGLTFEEAITIPKTKKNELKQWLQKLRS